KEEKLEARRVAEAAQEKEPQNAPVETVEADGAGGAISELKDAVILSLDEARAKADAAATDPDEDAPEAEPELPQTLSSSMSVLDRLRAKKPAEPRQEATLTDVASAIAAATAASAAGETSSADDAEAAPQKRRPVARALDDMRDELKHANGAAARLVKSTAAARDRRLKIAESLSRAEALLSELRLAQR
ncbi:MAG: hypothetical protein KAH44_31355, partial [Oricola sp.]|nr:hypothetical protein [Oricola sp.]